MSADPPEFMMTNTREKGAKYGQGVPRGELRENPDEVAQAQRPAPKPEVARRGEGAMELSPPTPDFNFVARPDANALPVLALDLGTATGWALRTSACITSGTMNWTQRKGETRGDRLLRLWRWLHEIHSTTPLSLIAYELVQHMGAQQRLAAHCYAQFQAIVLTFAARKEIPVVEVHTGTLKKAITGKGQHPKGTGKEVMMQAVMDLGFAPETFDESDALAVLHWAINLRGRA